MLRPHRFPVDLTVVDIGHVRLHVEERGEGPAVFLGAGLGGRGAFWINQFDVLASQFRVITFDHRGCGANARGVPTESITQLANDVLAIADALQIATFAYVGHSTGGAMGQHLALAAPDRIERLVLSCTWAGPDPYFDQLFELRHQILEQIGPEAYLAFGSVLANPVPVSSAQSADAGSSLAERLAAFPGIEVELSRIAAIRNHDLRQLIAQIACPTLCVGAKDDQITPVAMTEELAAAIPEAQLCILPEGGHFCPINAAKSYNSILLDFLGDTL